ncbi:MAG: helix-turn-helix domain-containing protein [Alphaproteobacteria bacterium]|nr:helix-turn-helix domain-containing protein [Alphaproteobacteria bacterium]
MQYDSFDDPLVDAVWLEETSEDDLWFLPGPMEEEPDFLPPGPRAELRETAVLDDWRCSEAGNAARLARLAGRIGALDDRLRRGPEGWRHRLALMEAADLSWFVGDRIGPDRLALWKSMRLSGVQDDTAALARVGWAVRRLTSGPGPEVDLSAFLDRRDPENLGVEAEPFADRAGGWLDLMAQAADLHPITRACMGFHLWSLAGLGQHGDRMEAAVTAARIVASEGNGALFAPLAMGGAGGLRSGGPPADRLSRWLDGMETACLTAMRHLDDIEAWSARAEAEISPLSGRTPPALCAVLTEWPLVSAPMAEALIGVSRAAVQRNLAWMEARGLIHEMTGQGRYRMWRVAT